LSVLKPKIIQTTTSSRNSADVTGARNSKRVSRPPTNQSYTPDYSIETVHPSIELTVPSDGSPTQLSQCTPTGSSVPVGADETPNHQSFIEFETPNPLGESNEGSNNQKILASPSSSTTEVE